MGDSRGINPIRDKLNISPVPNNFNIRRSLLLLIQLKSRLYCEFITRSAGCHVLSLLSWAMFSMDRTLSSLDTKWNL